MSQDLIEAFREAARGSIEEWTRRWSEDNGDSIRVRYFDDDTAEIERETATSFETVRVRFGVAVVPVETEPNKPTGSKVTKPWSEIPAGWFVYVPNGQAYEVMATKLSGVMQEVTLRAPDGKLGTFPRQRDAEVWCRRGSHGQTLDDAIETLAASFGKVEVISDEAPPWDE